MEIEDFAKLAMVDWEATVDRLPQAELHRIESEAAARATHYARISGYISRRQSGGKHADAVKAQNRVARGTRQALGYTYADDRVSF